MVVTMFKTIAEVRKANKANGHFFFSPDTMKFFNSKIETSLLKNRFFITSESFDGTAREYAVRMVNDDSTIDMIGDRYRTKAEAREALDAFIESV